MSITDRQLDDRLARLQRECKLPEQLWLSIEQRITRHRRRQRLAAIAAVLVMGVFAAWIVHVLEDIPRVNVSTAASLAATLFAAEIDAMHRSAPAGAEPSLDAAPESIRHAWNVNQNAIEELERALQGSPDNRLLLDLLTRARLRQSELINQATSTSLADNFRR